jgi:hypothetical protein
LPPALSNNENNQQEEVGMRVRRGFWWVMGLTVVALFAFWLANRFDTPAPARDVTSADLAPAEVSTANGFYWLVNLHQPAAANLTGPAVLEQTRQLYDPGTVRQADSTAPAPQGPPPDARMFVLMLRLPVPGLMDACRRDRPALDRDLDTFRYMLDRYERMVDCSEVADFTPPDPRAPALSLSNARGATRLWLAWAARRGLDGDWPGAAAMVQAHLRFCQRLVAKSRGLLQAMIGMALYADGLQTLADMANQPGFVTELGPGIDANLPPWNAKDLSLSNALLGETLAFREVLRNPDLQPGDAAGLRLVEVLSRFLTYQPNRTEGYVREWREGLLRGLSEPPFRKPSFFQPMFSDEPFWWLLNGYGKSRVETSLQDALGLYQRVYILIAWRDLVALSARWHGRFGPETPAAELAADLAGCGRIDPFSGKPYRFSPDRHCLYSVAENGTDDGGDKRDDLVVPWRIPPAAVSQ